MGPAKTDRAPAASGDDYVVVDHGDAGQQQEILDDEGKEVDNNGNMDSTIPINVVIQGLKRRQDKLLNIPDVRLAENIMNLKDLLLEIPELAHLYGSCHLDAIPMSDYEAFSKKSNHHGKKGKKKKTGADGFSLSQFQHFQNPTRLGEYQEIGQCEPLVRGDAILVTVEPYTQQAAWEHLQHFLQVLANPPFPLCISSSGNNNNGGNGVAEPPVAQEEDTSEKPEKELTPGEKEAKEARERKLLEKQQIEEAKRLGTMLEKVSAETYLEVKIQLDQYFRDNLAVEEITPPKVIKEIIPSGWNPVPGTRRMMGDLFYLRATSLNDQVLHITASCDGFFVNRSTDDEFNPLPSGIHCYGATLAECLALAIPNFVTLYESLFKWSTARVEKLQRDGGLNEFDISALGNSTTSIYQGQWVASKKDKDLNMDKANKSLYDPYGLSSQMAYTRDWNEEYQSALELPCETTDQRVIRARLLERLFSEFIENAKIGAKAVVEGRLVCLNPQFAEDSRVYVFNNVFLSVAKLGHAGDSSKVLDDAALQDMTSKKNIDEEGSPIATYCSSNQDLHGVQAVNTVLEMLRSQEGDETIRRSELLHTLNTVIVDYMGKRIIAQSIVPGILQQHDHMDSLLYGSMNMGKAIFANEKIHKELKKVGEPMHYISSKVHDLSEEKNQLELYSPVGLKGIKGSEGRHYLLDLMGLFPLDLNFYESIEKIPSQLDDTDYVARLRPELIRCHAHVKEVEYQTERKIKARNAIIAFKESKKNLSDEEEWDEETKKEYEMQVKAAMDQVAKPKPLRLDPNIYTAYQDASARDSDAVESINILSKFLKETQIPKVIQDMKQGSTPVDGQNLCDLLHAYGVNLRYLGVIGALCLENEMPRDAEIAAQQKPGEEKMSEDQIQQQATFIPKNVTELCEIEMIARAAKWHIRQAMEKPGEHQYHAGSLYIQVLNAVSSSSGKGFEEIRSALTAHVKNHFHYGLQFWFQIGEGHENRCDQTSLVRRVCQLTGIRLKHQNLSFGQDKPFGLESLDDVVPLVKSCNPKVLLPEINNYLDAAKLTSELGRAFALVQEAMTLTSSISGVANETIVTCCNSISNIVQSAGNVQVAIDHQKRALTLLNIIGHVDSAMVAQCHTSLGILYKVNNQFDQSIRHLRRAIYMYELMSGPRTSDIPPLYHHIAGAYVSVGHFEYALRSVSIAISRSEQKLQKAVFLRSAAHIVAKGFNNWTQAFNFEKEAYAIYKAFFGPDNAKTKECYATVEQYTRNSVQQLRSEAAMNNKAKKTNNSKSKKKKSKKK